MQPQALYYCPCDQFHIHASASNTSTTLSASTASSSSRHATATATAPTTASPSAPTSDRSASSVANPPNLPAYTPASRYAFHQLESLYFCDECDQIRCNRCVSIDISSYYCPNCLFEVPGASVKAEKNRCARNCFLCPCCTHTLSVLASDLSPDAAASVDPASPAASQGEPPYYLGCSFCRWDSKAIGLTFEKPTGLSLQLQRQEDNAPDVLEFERLKDHFDPFIKIQTQSAAVAAAIGSSDRLKQSNRSEASTKSASSSSRSARAIAAHEAASAALKNSKLLRDLPSLASSRYMSSLTGLSDRNRAGKVERDEIKPYEALTSYHSGRTTADQLGVMGKREKYRRDYVAKVQPTEGHPSASVDDKITSLSQRFSSAWDQPIRVSDLRPVRVPLKSKQSKRCPACRHIIIKPDIKAASNRFKIKLVAINYLPEVQLSIAPDQPFLTRSSASVVAQSTSAAGSTPASTLRRRPGSTLGLSAGASSSAGSGFLSSTLTANDVDPNHLLPGQTYTFQIKVTNPLDDPLKVKIAFVRNVPASHAVRKGPIDQVSHQIQALPEPRYIFSSKLQPSSETHEPSLSSATTPTIETDAAAKRSRSARPKLGWQVYPSATSFPLNAYNEVWELEESEDLLNDGSAASDQTADFAYDSSGAADADAGPEEDSEFSDINEEEDQEVQAQGEGLEAVQPIEADPNADTKRRSTYSTSASRSSVRPGRSARTRPGLGRLGSGFSSGATAAKELGRKPFVQKGHNTTLFLDLTLSSKDPPVAGPIEVAMHVTYSYLSDGTTKESKGSQKDFQFWTALRLGTVAGVKPE